MTHLLPKNRLLVGSTLACSAGLLLCSALSDLLPEVHFRSHDRFKLLAAQLIRVGVAVGIASLHSHERIAAPTDQSPVAVAPIRSGVFTLCDETTLAWRGQVAIAPIELDAVWCGLYPPPHVSSNPGARPPNIAHRRTVVRPSPVPGHTA